MPIAPFASRSVLAVLPCLLRWPSLQPCLPGGLLCAPPRVGLLWGVSALLGGPPCVLVPSGALGPFALPTEISWVSIVGVGPCFGLLCAFRSGSAFFLWVRPHVPCGSRLFGYGDFSFPLVCLRQVVWVPCPLFTFLARLFFCAFPCSVHSVGSWGCMLYLAGLDTSSLRSPSVL